ncbi:anti-anti-sigma factor [Amycolatopsis coloradensis]|uniref:Anti-anti-sigma factor n=1 Tax=Amycolatopsis coloradensis TaxID=76021 RepID=A0A1R0KI67_9PSEU|nr:STAS domain-containing protein [Amycolatopsis coloradensis]OLZ45436.1 anti-anti-sigma factor [Amycolatopsis coloradensis]
MTTAFTVTTRVTPTGPVLEYSGELDVAGAPAALAAIEKLTVLPGQQLVMDMTGLLFCDSSGISTLIAARNVTLAADAGIALAAVPHQLSRSLDLIGLADFFTTYPTTADAHAAWGTGPPAGA